MNKTTLMVLCSIIIIFSTQAQTDLETTKDKKVKFGLRAGYEFQVNESNLNYQLNFPYIGVVSDFSLSNNFRDNRISVGIGYKF